MLSLQMYLSQIEEKLRSLGSRPVNADLLVTIQAIINDINTDRQSKEYPFVPLEHWIVRQDATRVDVRIDPVYYRDAHVEDWGFTTRIPQAPGPTDPTDFLLPELQ